MQQDKKFARRKKGKRNKKKLTAATSHFVAAFHLEELRFALLALSADEKEKNKKENKYKKERRQDHTIYLQKGVQERSTKYKHAL